MCIYIYIGLDLNIFVYYDSGRYCVVLLSTFTDDDKKRCWPQRDGQGCRLDVAQKTAMPISNKYLGPMHKTYEVSWISS